MVEMEEITKETAEENEIELMSIEPEKILEIPTGKKEVKNGTAMQDVEKQSTAKEEQS